MSAAKSANFSYELMRTLMLGLRPAGASDVNLTEVHNFSVFVKLKMALGKPKSARKAKKKVVFVRNESASAPWQHKLAYGLTEAQDTPFAHAHCIGLPSSCAGACLFVPARAARLPSGELPGLPLSSLCSSTSLRHRALHRKQKCCIIRGPRQ